MISMMPIALVALGIALLAPSHSEAHPEQYPLCLSREGFLYCFYATRQQCEGTASGIGGCALNARLLFPDRVQPRRFSARPSET